MNDRCCEEDFGGSHYHCAKCGKVGGMYGHAEELNGQLVFTCDKKSKFFVISPERPLNVK